MEKNLNFIHFPEVAKALSQHQYIDRNIQNDRTAIPPDELDQSRIQWNSLDSDIWKDEL